MAFLKKYPIPIAGLILSLFALGNLLQSYSKSLRLAIGAAGLVLYVIYIAKLIVLNGKLKEEFSNPVSACVFLTFTMAAMLSAVYCKPFFPAAGYALWYIGFAGHALLILWFSFKFLHKFSIKTVFPSWFIVYVGIAVGALTAKPFGQILLGKAAFWFAFSSYLALLPVVCYRVLKIKQIPESAEPTLIIMAAPASLLLAGYMECFTEKNNFLVYLLLAMSFIFYVIALSCLPKLIMRKFTPGQSAFTFPLVISAIAIKMTNTYFEQSFRVLNLLTKFEELISVLIVAWVLVCYSVFLLKPDEPEK